MRPLKKLDPTSNDAVLFDLEQTLVDRNATFSNFLRSQYAQFEPLLTAVDKDEYVRSILLLDNKGYADEATIYQSFTEQFGLAPHLGMLLYNQYLDFYGQRPVLFPRVPELLIRLSVHYRLGLITNGRTVRESMMIDLAQIGDYFETILISETEGIEKPDVRIFECCLERMDVAATRTVYVGDHPVNDVAAPQSIGMKAIWMNLGVYDPPVAATETVSNIIDVAEILLR